MTADAVDRAGRRAGIVVDARSGGREEDGDRRSPATYPDPVVLALAALVKAAERHRRRRLALVRSDE